MYLNMVWCYVFTLTLLDISLNTKLTAQGKSHGVTVQDPLQFIDRLPFQELGAGSAALRLAPAALSFGRSALAQAHARSVTLTNAANATLHLASVAGSTPDFHASFFEAKSLPPQANTTFSVVYLGRREGFVAAQLYIHTSLGVHRYAVSAEGVASEWDVWPLLALRVPHNASVEPLLTLHNPTARTVQVRSVRASGAWLALELPDGEGAAPRALWAVPPRSTRALVRLRPRPEHRAPRTAYIRVEADIPGGGLVVAVEAAAAPPGEHALPPQLRLRPKGSRDPPWRRVLLAASSAPQPLPADAALWGARCAAQPFDAPPPPDTERANGAAHAVKAANGNSAKSAGVHVTSLRAQLDAFQPPTPTAQLTLDFEKMWEAYVAERGGGGGGAGAGAGAEGAWCAGWVRVGRAAVPYSVRLLPGTLRLLPDAIDFITSKPEELTKEREVRVRNEFREPLQLLGFEQDPGFAEYFHITETGVSEVGAGETVIVARVRMRAGVGAGAGAGAGVGTALRLRTARATYALPVRLHAGLFELRWQWAGASGPDLELGTLGTSSTRRVPLRLHNPTPAPLCAEALHVELGGAQLTLDGERCAGAGAALGATLTLVAPARAGRVAGAVRARSQHGAAAGRVAFSARAGALVALPAAVDAAPFAARAAPLRLDCSMAAPMRAVAVSRADGQPDAALSFAPAGDGAVALGQHTVGSVLYELEKLCEPNCYTGLDIDTPEGAAWLRRDGDAARDADAALRAARRALLAQGPALLELALHLHTTEVLQVPLQLSVRRSWPRLVQERDAGGALAGVGLGAVVALRLRNPAQRPLLLRAELGGPPPDAEAEEALRACGAGCQWASGAFAVGGWRAEGGGARAWPEGGAGWLLLAPGAELRLEVAFAPSEEGARAAYLYLRNNLTIVESVAVWGVGVRPRLELAGREPGGAPLLLRLAACAPQAVTRTVLARNAGAVPLRLRDWRLAGRACAARGFRLQPCAPLRLQPNETRALTITFAPDYTLARVPCALSVRTDTGRVEFALAAAAPARLLPACAAALPKPPFDKALRAAGTLLALLALALVLAAAALDAERELRRARGARPPPPAPPAPLDLRAVAAPARPAPPPPRRRRPARRPPAPDPRAERRAFERWRAEVLRRAADDHSSEDADVEPDAETDSTPPPEPAAPPPTPPDEDAGSIDSTNSTSSDTSSPADERYEHEELDDADDVDDDPATPLDPRTEDVRDEPKEEERRPTPAPEDASSRPARQRRSASPLPRRAERPRAEPETSRARPAPARPHARKDKPRRRGVERAAAAPPRAPPPAADLRAPCALRRGATWSSVVAEGAGAGAAAPPLAPIGSDVRRRPEARGSHSSLFYFNEAPEPSAWRPEPAAAWGAPPAAAWLWGAPPLRPPPGFPAPRAYDPFRSLAAIWGPGAMDWRRDDEPPPPPSPAP